MLVVVEELAAETEDVAALGMAFRVIGEEEAERLDVARLVAVEEIVGTALPVAEPQFSQNLRDFICETPHSRQNLGPSSA